MSLLSLTSDEISGTVKHGGNPPFEKLDKIKIGNDIKVRFSIYRDDGQLENMAAATVTEITVYREGILNKLPAVDQSLNTNPVAFTVKGDTQKRTGLYWVNIKYQLPEGDFREVDALAFELVAHSRSQSVGGFGGVKVETVHLSGVVYTGGGQAGRDGRSPYANEATGTWWSFDDNAQQYADTGLPYTGADGSPGKDGGPGKDGDPGKDGVGVESVQFNEENHLIVTYTDGAIEDAGLIAGGIEMEDVSPGEVFGVDGGDPVPVSGITLSPASFTLNVGTQRTLVATVSPANATHKSVTWSSSNPLVATVNNGVVTAIAEGSVTIRATATDGTGVAGESSGTIEQAEPGVIPVTGISLSKTSLTLDVGATEQLTATVSPSNATNKTLEWASSNPAIATVNGSGFVTAVTAGSVTVTASATDGSGKSASCPVTVQAVAPGPQALIDYDFSEYPDGYQGEIEDISGNGNTPTVTGLASYTTGRNGILGGTFMVNKHRTAGSESTLSVALPSLPDPNAMTFELYAHFRKNYNEYGTDGAKAFEVGALTLDNSAIINVGTASAIASSMKMVQNSMSIKGQYSSPNAAGPVDPAIKIDGFDDGTLTNAFHHVVFVVSKTRFACYLDGNPIVEAAGNTYDYAGKIAFLLNTDLKGDVKRFRVYNEALTTAQVEEKYAELTAKYE